MHVVDVCPPPPPPPPPRLEQVKARARAEARAAAQVEIQAQVKQTLEAERADYLEKLRNALLTERMKSEDERLIAQLYVSTRGRIHGVSQAGSGRTMAPPCGNACHFFSLST